MARCCSGPSVVEAMQRAEAAAAENSASRWTKIVTGRWYGPMGPFTPGSATVIASQQMAIPFWAPEAFTADRIGIEVTTLGAGSAVRLGIYASTDDHFPGELELDAGTVATTTTGAKEITISYEFGIGLYWLAAAEQGGTPPALRTCGSGAMPPVAANTFIGSSGSQGSNCYAQSAITGAFADWPATWTADDSAILIKVRAA